MIVIKALNRDERDSGTNCRYGVFVNEKLEARFILKENAKKYAEAFRLSLEKENVENLK